MARKYFKVNELSFFDKLSFFDMHSVHSKSQMFDALIAFAVRYNCELNIDTLDDYQEASEIFAYCSEEDFTVIKLACPDVVSANTRTWINHRE